LGEPYGNPAKGLRTLKRRGPDHEGIWTLPGLEEPWLGHRRLSIIDTSASANQPMVSPDGRYIIVYNGELYNFRELRASLLAANTSFRTTSDTEVLLALFAAEGEACLPKLNGIFSFGIWDRQDRKLTLVRDPLGVKPLYIARDGQRLAFASEMKALVRSGEVAPTLNPAAVARHLSYLWSPGRETVISQITKLLPGEVLTQKIGGPPVRRIYRDGAAGKPVGSLSAADYTPEKVAEALKMAVDRQMVADVPVGAFLSGGLDSSAICAFAQQSLGSDARLECFTIRNETKTTGRDGFVDDLPYARKVAAHLGVTLHEVAVDDTMNSRLAEYLYFMDEPNADPAGINSLTISEVARDAGLKVLLSGTGGDDVFTGYRRHHAVQIAQRLAWVPSAVRRGADAVSARLPAQPAALRRAKKLLGSFAGTPEERLIRLFQWQPSQTAAQLLDRRFAGDLTTAMVDAPMHETLDTRPAGYDDMQSTLRLEAKHFLADHNLNYTDKTGMAASVEVRVPFLDLDLVDYVHAIPSELKQKGSVGKWILKQAMEPYLPKDVIYRPKTGFGAPLRTWFAGPMRHMVEDTLSRSTIEGRGVFDFAAVERLRQLTRTGQADGTYTLFAVVCFEMWCRQFIDGNWSVDTDSEEAFEASDPSSPTRTGASVGANE